MIFSMNSESRLKSSSESSRSEDIEQVSGIQSDNQPVSNQTDRTAVIAGVSGGPDSMAMLDQLLTGRLIVDELENMQLDITVCHVNYHHRPTADRDQKITEDYCSRHHLRCRVFHADPEKCSENFQSWARDVRYGFFEKTAEEEQAKYLFLAHQQDDLIETWLMQKQRKAKSSIRGLAARSERNSLVILRPLLGQTKRQLEEYCLENRIEFGIDESNLEDEYLRNRVRHQIIEKMDETKRQSLLDQIRKENEEQKTSEAVIQDLVCTNDWQTLQSSPYVKEAIGEMIFQKTGQRSSEKTLKELCRQLQNSGHAQTHQQGIRILLSLENADHPTDTESLSEPADRHKKNREYHLAIQVEKTEEDAKKEQNPDKTEYWNAGSEKIEEYVISDQKQLNALCANRKKIRLCENGPAVRFEKPKRKIDSFSVQESDFPLSVRYPVPGDFIEMRFGKKKLSRIFIDRKIPVEKRRFWPVLTDRTGTVIFVPGTGCDRDHYRPEAATGFVLE